MRGLVGTDIALLADGVGQGLQFFFIDNRRVTRPPTPINLHRHQLFYKFLPRHLLRIQQPLQQLLYPHTLYLLVAYYFLAILYQTLIRVELFVTSLFLVFVERHHLVEEGFGDAGEWRDAVGGDSYFYVIQISNDRLNLCAVNPMQRLDHLQLIPLFFILSDRRFHRREVLLVAQIYVIQEGTLPRQKGA